MKNNLNKEIIKNPRSISQAEIISRYDISKNNDQRTLTTEYFNLSGSYPYMIDVINYVATHGKGFIKRVGDKNETHYMFQLPIDLFYQLALGEYKNQKNYLAKEIKRWFNGLDEEGKTIKRNKILPLRNGYTIITEPIRVTLLKREEKNEKKLLRLRNLKNYDESLREVNGFIMIEFLKPLWASVLEGTKGVNWFPLPSFFHAKMVNFIKNNADNPSFKKYGNFGNVSNYRRLYLYLSLHDNSKTEKIQYDAIDLTKATIPSNIREKNGKLSLHNWYVTHQFLTKGFQLFYEMSKKGLMDGVKLVPTSIYYSKPLKKLTANLYRGDHKNLPPFNRKVVDLTSKKEIK